jgi:hypothetical protein
MSEFKATPEQWRVLENTSPGCQSATTLELRDRVKNLESSNQALHAIVFKCQRCGRSRAEQVSLSEQHDS